MHALLSLLEPLLVVISVRRLDEAQRHALAELLVAQVEHVLVRDTEAARSDRSVLEASGQVVAWLELGFELGSGLGLVLV